MRTRAILGGLVAGGLLLASSACGSDHKEEAEASTTSTEATTTTLPTMPADFDWWAPAPTALGHGWTLGPCTSRTPATKGKALCLDTKDGRKATLEHFRFRDDTNGNLNRHAASFVEDFLADRKAGCGKDYRVAADPIVSFTLPDGVAKRYGFTGGAGGSGPDTERTVQWAGTREGVLVILTISAYDPGSCVPAVDQATLADLAELLPGIDALVQAAGLPPLTP
jgi:hypothetical protein